MRNACGDADVDYSVYELPLFHSRESQTHAGISRLYKKITFVHRTKKGGEWRTNAPLMGPDIKFWYIAYALCAEGRACALETPLTQAYGHIQSKLNM
jgi:hypothetical protein